MKETDSLDTKYYILFLPHLPFKDIQSGLYDTECISTAVQCVWFGDKLLKKKKHPSK